ncbi:hypothetical protein [Nonomuraea dietziae]
MFTRGRRRVALGVAALAALTGLVTGCGGDDDGDDRPDVVNTGDNDGDDD